MRGEGKKEQILAKKDGYKEERKKGNEREREMESLIHAITA